MGGVAWRGRVPESCFHIWSSRGAARAPRESPRECLSFLCKGPRSPGGRGRGRHREGCPAQSRCATALCERCPERRLPAARTRVEVTSRRHTRAGLFVGCSCACACVYARVCRVRGKERRGIDCVCLLRSSLFDFLCFLRTHLAEMKRGFVARSLFVLWVGGVCASHVQQHPVPDGPRVCVRVRALDFLCGCVRAFVYAILRGCSTLAVATPQPVPPQKKECASLVFLVLLGTAHPRPGVPPRISPDTTPRGAEALGRGGEGLCV